MGMLVFNVSFYIAEKIILFVEIVIYMFYFFLSFQLQLKFNVSFRHIHSG